MLRLMPITSRLSSHKLTASRMSAWSERQIRHLSHPHRTSRTPCGRYFSAHVRLRRFVAVLKAPTALAPVNAHVAIILASDYLGGYLAGVTIRPDVPRFSLHCHPSRSLRSGLVGQGGRRQEPQANIERPHDERHKRRSNFRGHLHTTCTCRPYEDNTQWPGYHIAVYRLALARYSYPQCVSHSFASLFLLEPLPGLEPGT